MYRHHQPYGVSADVNNKKTEEMIIFFSYSMHVWYSGTFISLFIYLWPSVL